MPRIPVGMLAAMISHASRSVEVSIRRFASVRKNARDDVDPVAPEVDQQADGAADVQHDDEREPERLRLGLARDQRVPAEQRREQDRVAEARDREELADPLQQAEHDRLERADRVRPCREHVRGDERLTAQSSPIGPPSGRDPPLVCSHPDEATTEARSDEMSADGTWNITLQTPMGAQSSTVELVTDGAEPDRHPERQRRERADLRRHRRRRRRELEGRHHAPAGADRDVHRERRRRLDLRHRRAGMLPPSPFKLPRVRR